MRRAGWMLATCLAAGLLTGCDQLQSLTGKKAEASPVAATVDGDKITEAQLDAELTAAGAANPKDPAVRQAVLQQIIARKLLAKEAHAQKLDQTPQAVMLRQSTLEAFDAGLVQKAEVDKTAQPTAADAEQYMQSHPSMFGARTLYLVDQLRVAAKPDAALIQALEPAKTLEEAEAVLKQRGLPYQRGAGEMDSLRVPPEMAARVAQLPPGAPFMLPSQGGLMIGRIRASKVQPVAGEGAVQLAQQALTAERRQKAVGDKIQALMTAHKDKITYAAGYAPPTPATPPAS